MHVEETEIPDVKILTPRKFGDHRGFFSETYNRETLAANGVDIGFVQDNHSFSAQKGTLRGLHFQTHPFAQDKLVRVTRGAIFDVAVDIRHGSPTFGKWVGRRIDAEAWNQILVPIGFAHGFVTLVEDTEVLYKTSAVYSPENDKGMAWDDPDVAVEWPLDDLTPVLSDKDKVQPKLADLPAYFPFDQKD